MVPRAGLEPAHPKAVDFESTASTNFATQANIDKEHQIRSVLYLFIDRLQAKNDFRYSIVFIFISVFSSVWLFSLTLFRCSEVTL